MVFEQRSRSGGIWNYTGDQTDEDDFQIPQTSPHLDVQHSAWSHRLPKAITATGDIKSTTKPPEFLSPIYERLETNIPRGLMGFQDLDWPQDSQLFPKHQTVLQYIEDYGKDVQDLVRYSTLVTNLLPSSKDHNSSWTVHTHNLRNNSHMMEVYDAVIVANGHFIVPYVPNIAGIKNWNEKFPAAISHSKYYRRPEDFADKKVVVVGNSASGSDISTQICQYSQHPLLWSSKSASMFKPTPSSLKRELPPISKFLPKTRGVEFEDGTVEKDIDAVVFATGYFYSLPFLNQVKPSLIDDGSHVQHTYQHLFYTPRPTLSFLALNQRIIPFPVAEAQSSVLARVYSGRLSLPPLSTMRAWERDLLASTDDPRDFHLLPFPKDGNYINEMSNWALCAPPRKGLVNKGKGKMPPVWGEWEFWCRENFPAIRAAFAAKGEARSCIRTLEQMGFKYDEYLARKASEEGKMI